VITAHTDVVGSLLRPAFLQRARAQLTEGHIQQLDYSLYEDQAVNQAIALQEDCGLEICTDGEMRRLSFQSQIVEAVEGFSEHDSNAFLWGNWLGDREIGNWNIERPKHLSVMGKLTRRKFPTVAEFSYLCKRTRLIPNIYPKTRAWKSDFWDSDSHTEAYASLDSFLADVVAIMREEITELVTLGIQYIQIDAPYYTLLLDSETRAFYEAQGWTLEQWLRFGVELDNAIMEGFPSVTFGFHL